MLEELDLPVALDTRLGPMELRGAMEADLDAIMALLADDPVSATRGDVASVHVRGLYARGLHRILNDDGNDLLVATLGDAVVGTMQLTVVPGMARRGSTRLMVEAVRVANDQRSGGIGGAMLRWVTDVAAPAVGASLVQLTSDAARTDAHRFYTRLGFVDSHVGFKFAVRR
ncbi:GNAT family N-acetyltransferase [Microbacterium dauci]|uniref:GNAT family N-acetyltransferase n=1 Tax=Microbacterium dauci TaxID=3048008 RepID=A0ABT6ZC39_9MICO|nr:GNAT family N-acetyltransferase [Microbacterium sp. LX3-4]MDJ1113714.1 GNAT family N-acetyltransferase [Microbacterium sp. LX3-4]